MPDIIGRAIIRVTDEIDKRGFDQSGSKVGKSIVVGAKVASGALLALTAVATKSALAAEEVASSNAKVTRVLSNMGKQKAAAAVLELADALEYKTGIDDSVIKKSEAILGSFSQVAASAGKTGGVFERATKATLDLGTVFGSSDAAAKQLGKALQDPVKGVAALNRAGVTFTAKQKEQIKNYVDTGNAAKAQNLILKEVEKQVGGTAEAGAKGSERLKTAFENVFEALGTVGAGTGFDAAANAVFKFADLVEANAGRIRATIENIKGFFSGLFAVVGSIAKVTGIDALIGAVGRLAAAVGGSAIFQSLIDGATKAGAGLQALSGFIDRNSTKIRTIAAIAAGVFAPFILQTTLAIAKIVVFNAQVAIMLARLAAQRAAAALAAGAQALYNASLLSTVVGLVRMAAGFVASTAAMIAQRVVMIAGAAATAAFTAAQWLLNAALNANPIGLIVAAVALLVAGLVIAYKKSTTFRNIVNAAFESVKSVVSAVIGFITGYIRVQVAIWTAVIRAASTVVSAVWNTIKAGAVAAWTYIKTFVVGKINDILSVGRTIGGIFSGVWDGVKTAGVAAFDVLKGAINAVIRGVNVAIDVFNKIPKVPNVRHIPELAVGARNFRGGTALVGEQGPELVNLPKGSDVYTARETAAIGAGSGMQVQINNYGPITGSDNRKQWEWAARYAPRLGAPSSVVTV